MARMASKQTYQDNTRRPSGMPSARSAASSGQRIALYGLLTCIALVAGYLEALIPLPVTVPGVKLGLGNVVVLFALDRLGAQPAFFLMLAKVACSGLLFSNLSMLAYSLAGGLVSWALMALAYKSGWFSITGTSVVGGLAHNAGQLALVAALFSPAVAAVNIPVLAVSGAIAGVAVGVLVELALRAVPSTSFLAGKTSGDSGARHSAGTLHIDRALPEDEEPRP